MEIFCCSTRFFVFECYAVICHVILWSKHTHIDTPLPYVYITQQKYIVVRRKAHNNKREENKKIFLLAKMEDIHTHIPFSSYGEYEKQKKKEN